MNFVKVLKTGNDLPLKFKCILE